MYYIFTLNNRDKSSPKRFIYTGITPFSEHPCHLIVSHQSSVNIDIIESGQTSSAMNLPPGFGALITVPNNI